MKLKFMCLVLTVFLIMLIMCCSNKQVIENTNEMDKFEDVIEAAKDFINEKGWNDKANNDLKHAKVEEIIANNKYELLDKTYDGKEVLIVSFEDVDNAVTGIPSILVDPNINEVIGYMPSE